ncbi:MAG: FkbM family methyltransferase [Bacteroidia bacterium]|nr:FkbM family methyltransferase [Bacteroidia bacterium]MDW8348441.1 FkbM family methyltransferase [Bacteroidia bacterium]
MASVNSPIRRFVKPILFKLFGKRLYKHFQYLAKLKDIKERLVEEPEIELLPHFIHAQDETLDIGANYAYYTERMANLCKQGKVYAFEPIPFTASVAQKIIKKLKLDNVVFFQKGVGNKTETMQFTVPKLNFGAISAGQAHIATRNNEMIKNSTYHISDEYETFNCQVVEIDTFLLPKLKNLTFVKIDIEGAEYFALQGMKQTLLTFKPVILIEIVPLFLNSFNVNIQEFQSFIEKDLNYLIFEYNKPVQKLEKVTGRALEKDKNYILIHPDKLSPLSHLIV